MRVMRRLAVASVAAGVLLLAGGIYLPAKAALAQVLLRRAWAATGDHPVRPWPWARTWPVARLEVPVLGIDEIVLAGDQGAALAFAPGHVDGTAEPGQPGNVVVAGHRDTVFAFLGDLTLGDELTLEGADGSIVSYTVTGTAVVHETETSVLDPTDEPTLTLVTCYPLDGVRTDGPLRYVVRATATGRDPGGHSRPPGQDAG
jgi:sortase A